MNGSPRQHADHNDVCPSFSHQHGITNIGDFGSARNGGGARRSRRLPCREQHKKGYGSSEKFPHPICSDGYYRSVKDKCRLVKKVAGIDL